MQRMPLEANFYAPSSRVNIRDRWPLVQHDKPLLLQALLLLAAASPAAATSSPHRSHHGHKGHGKGPKKSDAADYVIVGGGTGGCALTARMCAAMPHATFALLERATPRNASQDLLVLAHRNTWDTVCIPRCSSFAALC